ncbi:mitochondrial fission factor isoform X1 [Bufo bufo]|uniref:mitochondrial fission factor isoform X1 n=2 Tax=Bufo bufo TaxID=8384 RepID=UPI001ABDB707|nr:mitochondrial fission factor isoform X1 [Bufo bufo]XP_040283742.1 mitochondrial fission factor isoform X1 [Bufo bufo]XP_040283743.1 mitochondrial fission factor isoform X1 [Bufo bufo]
MMSVAGFSPPAAEMAEINRMQYDIEYTEGISQRMRVPEMLKVASSNTETGSKHPVNIPAPGVIMQVPERIVVAGHNEEASFSRPADLDLIQTTPFEHLALKTPPRVLTLSERPLDFLDLERPTPVTPQNDEVRHMGRQKRERSVSENTIRHNGQLVRNDSIPTPPAPTGRPNLAPSLPADGADLFSARGILSLIQTSTRRAYQQVLDVLDENRRPVLRGGSSASAPSHHDNPRYAVSTLDASMDGTPDDLSLVDAASLRRQIIKLNRRLLLLEEENKERVKREMVMYSITVAFWLLNSWFWFRR